MLGLFALLGVGALIVWAKVTVAEKEREMIGRSLNRRYEAMKRAERKTNV